MGNNTFIYFLEREDKIPFWVGKTNNIKYRFSKHKTKFGKNINIVKIDNIPLSEWRFWEEHYISLFKSWGFKLENKNEGGGGSNKQSFETIAKKILKLKGKSKPKDFGDKIRQNRNHIEAGKLSSISNQKHYKKGSKRNQKISQKLKGRQSPILHTTGKWIIQYDLNMNYINEFPSCRNAGIICNLGSESIRKCVIGKHKTAYGYIWKYKNS